MSTEILNPELLETIHRVQPEVETVYRYIDLTGVFLMGVVGGTIARQKNYDIVGFVFLALFSALGGGMLRDALIQKGTVAAIAEREYLILASTGALIAWLARFQGKWWGRFQAHADAVISGAWAVTGAAKALTWDLPLLSALFMGVLTATGGGMIRDVVTGERPQAFRGDSLIVTPALLAALVYAIFHHYDEQALGMIIGAVAGAALSIASYWFGWHFRADPEFAPANAAAREARAFAEAVEKRAADVIAEIEPGFARQWRHEHHIVRKADEANDGGDARGINELEELDTPVTSATQSPRDAGEHPSADQEYRFEDMLRKLHYDDSPEGRETERAFITAWLAWQEGHRSGAGDWSTPAPAPSTSLRESGYAGWQTTREEVFTMAAAGKPTTTLLEEGKIFDTKQMSATDGAAMPRHKASIESALIVTAGRCVVKFDDGDRILSQGDSVILPEGGWHAIHADPEFTAVHIMPKGIRFTFSG